jgi:hypothetical protein
MIWSRNVDCRFDLPVCPFGIDPRFHDMKYISYLRGLAGPRKRQSGSIRVEAYIPGQPEASGSFFSWSI